MSPALDTGKDYRAARGIPIFPALDGFRAFAILGIVLLHLLSAVLAPTSDIGLIVIYGPLVNLVDVLFILSGFVVFLPTATRGEFGNIGSYAIRRAARLLPALWVAILVVLILISIWPDTPGPQAPGAGAALAHAVGLHVPLQLFDVSFPFGLAINGPLWTLSLEITFYLLLPFVAVPFFRRPLAGLAIAAAITIVWKIGANNLGSVLDVLGVDLDPLEFALTEVSAMSQFPAWAFHFALGMLAARLIVQRGSHPATVLIERHAAALQAVSLLAFCALTYVFGRYALEGNPTAPTDARGNIALTMAIPISIAVFMLATCLAPARRQFPFAQPAVRQVGDFSYGIYLIHLPLILFFAALLAGGAIATEGTGTRLAAAALAVTASVAYGYASGRFLESPIRRWAHRYGARSRAQRGDSYPADSA